MDKKHQALLQHVLTDVKKDLGNEEIIHLLLDEQISESQNQAKDTLGQRLADKIAGFAGSWTFIGLFLGALLCWMALNVYWLGNRGFDPYPFILLNLVLSCIAAIQAPLIMMSQNRQEQKDRRRGENDYRVNLKTEIIMSDIHEKLDTLLENQAAILKALDDRQGR